METMTQENKELLLKDLCARLPYYTKADDRGEFFTIRAYHPSGAFIDDFGITHCTDNIKPYLFPMSSITEKQKEELDNIFNQEDNICEKIKTDNFEFSFYNKSIFDFLNKYHLDWRGLISKDLAKDATGLNIY